MALSPFIKWPGGKEQELQHITPNLPEDINRYIEPFVGGGAVLLSLEGNENINEYIINDFSRELINLYTCIHNNDETFFNRLLSINNHWTLISNLVECNYQLLLNTYRDYTNNQIGESSYIDFCNNFIVDNLFQLIDLVNNDFNLSTEEFIKELKKNFISKVKRMNKLESDKGPLNNEDVLKNIEAGLKSGYYMYIRYIYNNVDNFNLNIGFSSAIFYFIREFCYSSMFRYNKSGGFNVPYGGISYNRKDFLRKINYLQSIDLQQFLAETGIYNLDFEEFFDEIEPRQGDFIFLDPPYDSDFSTYAQNSFTQQDQIRLANCLRDIQANFMLVIKNTEFIFNLYNDLGFNINFFDKSYLVSFQNRNNREVTHLMITNY